MLPNTKNRFWTIFHCRTKHPNFIFLTGIHFPLHSFYTQNSIYIEPNAALDALNSGVLPCGLNEIYICLMPKVKLLGSKTLDLNVLELQFVMLANHDQNVLVFVLDLLKVCLYEKLESSSCRIYCVNLSGSID